MDAVGPTPAGAEPFNGHVGSCENHVNGVFLATQGCQVDNLVGGEWFTQRIVVLKDLSAEREEGVGGVGEVVVFVSGFPPRGNWWLGCGVFRRGERGDEIGENSSLGRLETAVPDEIDRDFASEERAFVVLELQLLIVLSWLSGKSSSCWAQMEQRNNKD